MADQQSMAQYNMIYTLAIPAGIKRDGTIFETHEFTDGVWCRFQREVAKKMGGYRTIFNSFSGIYRGLINVPYNGVNYIFAGNAKELDVFTTGTTIAAGTGPYVVNVLPGQVEVTITGNTSSTFNVANNLTSTFSANTKVIFAQTSNATVYTVSSSSYTSANTVVTITGGSLGNNLSNVWIANSAVYTPDARNDWQFDAQFSPSGGQLVLFAHPGLNLINIDNGVPSQVLVGSVTPGPNQTWTFSGLSDSQGQNPTYKPISVDGGVCVLYPFIFVYGSHGFIANNNVSGTYANQGIYDWNGPLANQVNVSSSKIVKGMPMRGGTNSPSGLFWATDSLIRVSFNSAGSGSSAIPSTYWNYDIVSSQISIMSSNAVVDMDGAFFWMGVDRFYVYNGSVQVLPNDKNVNWLFDNINYEQRQKVWATKIPRYNEIWFFYPRGTATECTDAIIYNTKDKLWYDAGSAIGAQRSCGYTTELFPTPIWADWNYNPIFSEAQRVIAHPSSLAAPTAYQFYVKGDLTPQFSPGSYVCENNELFLPINGVPSDLQSPVYLITNSQFIINGTVDTPGVTLVTVATQFPGNVTPSVGTNIYTITGGYTLWQHEFGQNMVTLTGEEAVYSSITTSDISWITGTPSGDQLQGVNRRMHLRRFEPNFLQTGMMSMTILGRKFADDDIDSEMSGPFYFNEDTGKIDLRVEYRLIRLKFESNVLNGNYEMGRNIITCEYGDERP
jgi:hypothetical protein